MRSEAIFRSGPAERRNTVWQRALKTVFSLPDTLRGALSIFPSPLNHLPDVLGRAFPTKAATILPASLSIDTFKGAEQYLDLLSGRESP